MFDLFRNKQAAGKIDPNNIPKHVAIIMDGNGRWAKKRGLPREAGHAAGEESLRVAVRSAAELGIKQLSVYAFSTENWKRPEAEVKALMQLLKMAVQKWLKDMVTNNVRIRVLGRVAELPADIQASIRSAEEATKGCSRLTLNIMINYGGRAELVDAVKVMVQKAVNGALVPAEVTERLIDEHLYTAGIPDPDLLIRTSGELRISNYLLWQSAYTEFYFTTVLWPDFRKEHFSAAVIEYQKRNRRKGDIG